MMHRTNEFTAEIFQQCVAAGMTRLNVNQVVLRDYEDYCKASAGRIPLTNFMETSSRLIQQRLDWMMDAIGSDR